MMSKRYIQHFATSLAVAQAAAKLVEDRA